MKLFGLKVLDLESQETDDMTGEKPRLGPFGLAHAPRAGSSDRHHAAAGVVDSQSSTIEHRHKNSSFCLELLSLEWRSWHGRVVWTSHCPDAEGYFQMGVDLGDVEHFWPVQFLESLPQRVSVSVSHEFDGGENQTLD